ncbi:unnamed protein product [Brassica oleracea var. botrytis]
MPDWGPKGKFGPPLPAVVIIYAPRKMLTTHLFRETLLKATAYPEIPVALRSLFACLVYYMGMVLSYLLGQY